MKLINWIKRKLYLHTPLWICVLLAGAALLLLPDSTSSSILLFLFFAYFLARYLWRKHLKETGKLSGESSGIFSLVFWGFIGAIWLYSAAMPESPQLVLYETSDPNVFDKNDQFFEITTPSENGEGNKPPLSRKAKKGVLRGALEAGVNGFRDRLFTCAFVLKGDWIEPCSALPDEVKRIELDGDETTVELLMSDKDPKDCIKSMCNLWVIQTTQAQITQFNELLKERKKAGLTLPMATLVNQWENIVTPVLVHNELSNGWRPLQITDVSGKVSTWKGE